MSLNATDLQLYPCAGSPPIDAFMADTLTGVTPVGTFIDALNGKNTNRGLSAATALADPSELEQRWSAGRTTGQGDVGNSPPVPRRGQGLMVVNLLNIVNGWLLRVPFELARQNQPIPGLSLAYELPLNGVGVPLNATLTFWDEGGTCSAVSQIQLFGNGVNVGGVPAFALTNPSQQVTIRWDGANWQVIANTNPGGAPGTLGQRVTFVLSPAGVPLENVYTTWAAMMADVALVAGPKLILIDTPSAVPAHATAGAWNIDECTFSSPDPIDEVTLLWDNGATATWQRLELDGVDFKSASAAPVTTQTTLLTVPTLILRHGSRIASNAGAAPFLSVQSAGALTFIWEDSNSLLGDGTHAWLTVGAGAVVQVDVNTGSAFTANGTAGAGTVNVLFAASGIVSLPQAVAVFASFPQDLASRVGFTVATAGNWNPVPTFVKPALDQLAAPNVLAETNAAGIGAGAVIAFDTAGTISKKRSGKVRITSTMTVLNSVPTKNTFSLRRDGAVVAAFPTTAQDTVAGTTNTPATLAWIDTLPDALPHTYGIQCDTNGGGNASVFAAKQVSVAVDEI
jgi:hypothetical protein